MKILITGAEGMLGKDLVPFLGQTHEVYPLFLQQLDITDRDQVSSVVQEVSPDLIINCAAYTQVDRAEEESEQAFLVNGIGVQNLGLASERRGIPLCQISTDYVFDGLKASPYTPFDNTNPINVYGTSKLAGEKCLQWVTNRFYIIRTSWLYGREGNNFVSTILRLAAGKPEIRVVQDQIGSPTATLSLCHAIANLINTGAFGIYHFTDETDGGISWYDFAREIIRLSGMETRVVPVTSEEFPRPAPRPKYAVLDTWSFSAASGMKPRSWKEALKDYLA